MAVDMFLELAGITGESKDASHLDQIEIFSWTWGLSGPPVTGGKTAIQNIVVQKKVDSASPPLLTHSATGAVIPSGTVSFRRAGGATFDFLLFKLTNVTVISVGLSSNSGDDGPSETVSLAFTKVELDYTTETNTGGAGPKKVFSFG